MQADERLPKSSARAPTHNVSRAWGRDHMARKMGLVQRKSVQAQVGRLARTRVAAQEPRDKDVVQPKEADTVIVDRAKEADTVIVDRAKVANTVTRAPQAGSPGRASVGAHPEVRGHSKKDSSWRPGPGSQKMTWRSGSRVSLTTFSTEGRP